MGSDKCVMSTDVSAGQITCTVFGSSKGAKLVKTHIKGVGWTTSDTYVNFVFRLNSLSVNKGSKMGGTEITLTGEGFPVNSPNDINV